MNSDLEEGINVNKNIIESWKQGKPLRTNLFKLFLFPFSFHEIINPWSLGRESN